MKNFLAISLFFLVSPAFAVICKSVGSNGEISYTNVPAGECDHPVKLREPTRYKAPELPASTNDAAPSTKATAEAEAEPESDFVAYSRFVIEQPANDATIQHNAAGMPVSIGMEPALQPGHRIRITLDGVLLQPPFTSQTLSLQGVYRGSHTLQAQVVNSVGDVLGNAEPVTFFLRQASIQ